MDESRELEYLRQLFESEIRRVDQVLAEREKQVDRALDATSAAAEKADIEAERARVAANEWRGAMNDREAKFVAHATFDRLVEQVDGVVARQDEGRGRQAAWIAAAGIIATLLAVGVGQIIRQGITSGQVSLQIEREAPWTRDKAAYERRLSLLERQVQIQEVQIARLRADVQALQIRVGLIGR